MSSSKNNKSKRKAYFFSNNPSKKQKFQGILVPGLKGFICTCNGNEKGCIREALNILDDYSSSTDPLNNDNALCDEDDIEKQLKDEVDTVKKDKLFRVVDTGQKNCIFISSEIENVTETIESIMKSTLKSGAKRSRNLIRITPVEVTCKAYNEDIKKAVQCLLDPHFKNEPTTYCIIVNKRSNNNLLRTEVIDDIARLVRDRNENHKADLKNAEKTILVDIIKNVCCLSVVNNFFTYRKFNLIELASNNTTPKDVKPESCSPETVELENTPKE